MSITIFTEPQRWEHTMKARAMTTADAMHRHLIAAAESYCRAKRISMITLGLRVVRSGNVFERLDCGGSITVRNYGRFMDFFRQEGHDVPALTIGGWGAKHGRGQRNPKAASKKVH